MEAMIWIGLIILFVVVEIATVGLTSIWFAGGALISLILCLCGVGLGWQIGSILFVGLLLYRLRHGRKAVRLDKATKKTGGAA